MKTKALLLIILFFTAFAAVKADGAFIHPPNYQQDIYEPQQQAIIKYYNSTETLILRAVYQGANISEFIWIIPVPNIPEASTAEPSIFQVLSQITAPQVKRSSSGNALFGQAKASAAEVSRDDFMVELISRTQVGIYDVSILTAKKAQTMIDWFNTRGYRLDQKALPMVETYLNNDWYFVAVRVNLTNQSDQMRYTGLLQPLQFVFNSSDIVYPLKISSLNPGDTEVLVYVLADRKVKPANTTFACIGMDLKTQSGGGCQQIAMDAVKSKLEFAGKFGPGLDGFADKEYFVTKIRMKFNSSNPIQSDLVFVNYGDNNSYRMVVDEHGNEIKQGGGIFQTLWEALMLLFQRH